MKPIIFIIIGIILSFFSALKLIRFSSEISDKISEINKLFSSDAFLMYKELRNELDELNFSYYEILERQDERISSLEISLENRLKGNFFSEKSNYNEQISKDDFDLKLNKDSLNSKVISMYKDGITKEQIATELNIGTGMVDTICSIYSK